MATRWIDGARRVPATPATLRLPVPLGDRTLFDAGTIGQGGAGG